MPARPVYRSIKFVPFRGGVLEHSGLAGLGLSIDKNEPLDRPQVPISSPSTSPERHGRLSATTQSRPLLRRPTSPRSISSFRDERRRRRFSKDVHSNWTGLACWGSETPCWVTAAGACWSSLSTDSDQRAETVKRRVKWRQPARIGGSRWDSEFQITGQEEVRLGSEESGPDNGQENLPRHAQGQSPPLSSLSCCTRWARTVQGFQAHTMQQLGNLQHENVVQVAVACKHHSKDIKLSNIYIYLL